MSTKSVQSFHFYWFYPSWFVDHKSWSDQSQMAWVCLTHCTNGFGGDYSDSKEYISKKKRRNVFFLLALKEKNQHLKWTQNDLIWCLLFVKRPILNKQTTSLSACIRIPWDNDTNKWVLPDPSFISAYHCFQRGTTVQLSFYYADALLLLPLESEKLEASPIENSFAHKNDHLVCPLHMRMKNFH